MEIKHRLLKILKQFLSIHLVCAHRAVCPKLMFWMSEYFYNRHLDQAEEDEEQREVMDLRRKPRLWSWSRFQSWSWSWQWEGLFSISEIEFHLNTFTKKLTSRHQHHLCFLPAVIGVVSLATILIVDLFDAFITNCASRLCVNASEVDEGTLVVPPTTWEIKIIWWNAIMIEMIKHPPER